MPTFETKTTRLCLDADAKASFIGAPGGQNLLTGKLPFARMSFFEAPPAFTNEWIHPPVPVEPVYSDAVAAAADGDSLTLTFADGAKATFGVQSATECLVFTLTAFREGSKGMPTILRFAQLPVSIQGEIVCAGMALNLETNAATLPGLAEMLYAEAYPHIRLVGAAYALAVTPRAALQSLLQALTVQYTQNIPYMKCAGAFASESREMRGSYIFSYGDYMPGGLDPSNVDAWIEMLRAIGATQVDFHGAEGKNFTFGDCIPNPKIFPEGRKSFKFVIDRLHAAGIKSILHSYSSLIEVTSSLVTPIPHRALGYNRTFELAGDIDAAGKTVRIVEDTSEISLLHTAHYNSSTYIVVDDEIIQFKALGEHELRECVRGALGTHPAPHKAGTKARNLKRMYDIFAPDVDGELFRLVAQNTADFFNECGFDMFYFDALEGTSVLEGFTYNFYYTTKFVYEVARRIRKPAGMEMSTMHHNLWFVRSRMGAWDRPSRAYKQVLARHSEQMQRSQARSTLPQNLGWWLLGPNAPALKPHEYTRITTDVYEYMARLALAYDYSMSFQGITLPIFHKCEEVRRFAEVIRRYETLRMAGALSREECAKLAKVECHLLPDGFHEVEYVQAVAEFKGGAAEIALENNFEAQVPTMLRLEPLYKRANGRSLPFIDIARDFDQLRVITSRNVKASIARDESPHGAAIRLQAQQSGAIGCARCEMRYPKYYDFDGQFAYGVWIHGDGKGEILNLQLRSQMIHTVGSTDRIVKIDFVGWRYFSLIENSADVLMQYLWPFHHRQLDREGVFKPTKFEGGGNDWPDSMYMQGHIAEGNPKHIAAWTPDYTKIESASIWINGMREGETYDVRIADWRGHEIEQKAIASPSIGSLQLEGTLPPNSIAEYTGEDWFVVDGDSVTLPVTVKGRVPNMAHGKNTLRLTADAPDGARMCVTCGFVRREPLVRR